MRKLLTILLALAFGAQAHAAVIKTVAAGATDESVTIKIIDLADGAPETGVTFETAGIDLEYWIHGPNAVVDITEVTQTIDGTHTDGGFVAVGHGTYRLDLPDAALAAAGAIEIQGTVTGMIVIGGTVLISPPADAIAISGDTAAADNFEAFLNLMAGQANGAFPSFGITASGTAQAYTAGTPSITLADSTAAADDDFNGHTILVWGSNEGDVQSATITDYTATGDVATIDAALSTAPTGTIRYVVFGTAEGASGLTAQNVWEYATRILTANTNLNDPTAATIADAVLDEDLTAHQTTGSLGAAIGDGDAGAGLTAADDAIIALIGTPSDFGSGTSTVAGNLQDLADNGTAVFDRSTDSLQAIRDRGDAAWTGAGGGDVTTIESTDATDYFDALVAGLALEATAQSVLTDTTEIGAAGAGLSNVPWNSAWDAEAESEANDALVALHLDHLLAVDYDPATPPGTATALLNELVESDAGVSRFTVNALENAPSGTGASAETIADEVETRTIAGVTTVGSVTGSVGSVTGAVGSVAGDVDGNVTGSVGSVAAGGITAASVATDAIGADELAASAVTEVQAGLALEATLGTPADTDLATDIANAHASVLANRTQIFIGTADSGDTNTLVDSALGAAFANDVDIDGAYVVRGDGQRCLIDSFTQATSTLEFGACTFTGAWSTQSYNIYPAGTQ
jgi:hypothetical protein